MTWNSHRQTKILLSFLLLTCVVLTLPDAASGQGRRGRAAAGPPTLGLDQGSIELDTPDFNLKLVKVSQTVAALEPKGADGFDFTPADQLEGRSTDGFHHLGDLTFRLRTGDSGPWQAYELHGKKWGRARLTVTYADGLRQSINYYVIKPAAQTVADMGRFLTTEQWFEDPDDPFGRSPSVMSYDRETNSILTQESRAWIAGLGDEGGSGSFVAAAMKQFGQPNRTELEKYEQFVNQTLWGGIQYSEGDNKYGVRKSLFYYTMPDFEYDPNINWGSWTSWNRREAESIAGEYAAGASGAPGVAERAIRRALGRTDDAGRF